MTLFDDLRAAVGEANVLEEPVELHEALKERHRQLHALQKLYRLRLRYLAPAAEAPVPATTGAPVSDARRATPPT